MKTVRQDTATVIMALVLISGFCGPKWARATDAASKADNIDRQLRAVISKYVSHPSEVEKLMPKARSVRRQTVDKLQVFTDAWFIGKLDSMVASYVGRGTPAPAVVHMALDSLVATAAVLSARRGQQSGRSDKRQPRTEVGRADRGDGAAALRKQTSVKNGSEPGKTRKGLTLDLGKGVTMKLMLIPAGKFMMGSPAASMKHEWQKTREGPQRQVTISKPFYMGIHEVTQAQWYAVMGTKPWRGKVSSKSGDDNAASCISWGNASKFCEMLSKKIGKKVILPTEAQWEYACRSGSKTAYCFGDDESRLGEYAWYRLQWKKLYETYQTYRRSSRAGLSLGGPSNWGLYDAHKVGQKRPNAWGLYDMHGNLFEWCSDWYDKNFYAKAKNVDPKNTVETGKRVVRGGGIVDGAWAHRSANRFGQDPKSCSPDSTCGVRVLIPTNLRPKIKPAIQSNATTISMVRETAAAKRLKLAKLYVSNEKLALAGKIVLEIIEKYPETKVAAEAQTLLKSVSAGLKHEP